MTVSRTPTLAEVLDAVLRARLARVWTALPATIESYDHATQKATVRPAVQNRLETIDGEELLEMPAISGVPVAQPSGGGYFAAFPLAQGDPVLLVFASRSVDTWKFGDGSRPVDPADLRTHDLSDAFAIPGGRPFGAPLEQTSAEDLVLGKDGGVLLKVRAGGTIEAGEQGSTQQFVALADKVKAELDAMKADLDSLKSALSSHTHAGVMTGAGTSGTSPAFASWAPHTPASVAGSVLKAEE